MYAITGLLVIVSRLSFFVSGNTCKTTKVNLMSAAAVVVVAAAARVNIEPPKRGYLFPCCSRSKRNRVLRFWALI